jgi:hypothetical protein
MDFDVAYYNHITHKVFAYVEEKFGLINHIDLNDYEFDVLIDAAESNRIKPLPVLCVVYYPFDLNDRMLEYNIDQKYLKDIAYYVSPVNDAARSFLGAPRALSELEYVSLIERMGGVRRQPGASKLCSDINPRVWARIPTIVPRHQPQRSDSIS